MRLLGAHSQECCVPSLTSPQFFLSCSQFVGLKGQGFLTTVWGVLEAFLDGVEHFLALTQMCLSPQRLSIDIGEAQCAGPGRSSKKSALGDLASLLSLECSVLPLLGLGRKTEGLEATDCAELKTPFCRRRY